jgi:TetR/AcrR family transcriptional regulator, cholesterol catabolism regulator
VTSFEAILRAAVYTFSERGYAASGIRDIAAAAGVTSGTLYLYSPNKVSLLQSIMNVALDELLRTAAVATAGSADPGDALERLIRSHVAMQAVNPRTVRVVDGELRFLADPHREEIVAKRDAYEAAWNRVLRAGAESGLFRVSEPSVTRLAVLEMCNGVARWYRPDGPHDLDQIQDLFVGFGFGVVGYPGIPQGADPALAPRRLVCEPDVAAPLESRT